MSSRTARVIFITAVFWTLIPLTSLLLARYGWKLNGWQDCAFTIGLYVFSWVVTCLTWRAEE